MIERLKFAQVRNPHRPRFTTIQENGAHQSLIDTHFCTQSDLLPGPQSSAEAAESEASGAYTPVYVFYPLIRHRDNRTEICVMDYFFESFSVEHNWYFLSIGKSSS